jgi:NAD(P)-dependent dehydrogenase (short-subunit alcohol dehydrogenase family)
MHDSPGNRRRRSDREDGPIKRFEGRACIVAGGARGIGARTAEALVAEGARVVVADVNREAGASLVDRLGAEQATFTELDVRDAAACARAVERCVNAFGALDHVVNCAIRIRPGPLAELSLEDWQAVVDIGLTGTFLMCQAAGRWLINHGRRGSLVNLSSIGGRFPYGGAGAYSTVKGGVILLTQQLGIEWAEHGIRVNAVAPGHIETPLTAYLQDPDIRRARADATPLGRIGQPDDVVRPILFLLSDEADWMTASVVDVDGGIGASIMNHMAGRRWDATGAS